MTSQDPSVPILGIRGSSAVEEPMTRCVAVILLSLASTAATVVGQTSSEPFRYTSAVIDSLGTIRTARQRAADERGGLTSEMILLQREYVAAAEKLKDF